MSIPNSAALPRMAAMLEEAGRIDDLPRLDEVRACVARMGRTGRSWTRNEPGNSSKTKGNKIKMDTHQEREKEKGTARFLAYRRHKDSPEAAGHRQEERIAAS